MKVQLYIQNERQQVFAPAVKGDITWETSRTGQPGKITFSVVADDMLKIDEGNAVRLDVDGQPAAFGFLFERSFSREPYYKLVAYDQLRYLKNKDTLVYENLSAGEVIQKIAGNYKLRVGTLEDTGYKIPHRAERNQTLFDMIQKAINETMMHKSEIYVLYDDVGALTFKNIKNMKIGILIDEETAQDYDCKFSIDGETYNQIKLVYKDREAGSEGVCLVRDIETIGQWGVLQRYEEVGQDGNIQATAEGMLSFYNKKSKSISVKNAFGDVRIRAGCLLPVRLELGNEKMDNFMLVENVKHSFSGGRHTMDLTLRGHGFFG